MCWAAGGMEPTTKRVQRAGSDVAGHHALERLIVQQGHEISEALESGPFELHGRIGLVAVSGCAGQRVLHPVDDEGELGPGVFRFGEGESQQPVAAELPQGPQVGADAFLPSAGVRHGHPRPTAGGSVESHAPKRAGGKSQSPVQGQLPVGEPAVGLVQPEEIFALYVEDERLRVDGVRSQPLRMEQRVKQESGVRCLGGDARNSADGSVSAPGAVQELEIRIDRLAGSRQPDGHPPLHLIEIQGALEVLASNHLGAIARMRRKEDFRIDAGDLNVRRVGNVDGKRSRGGTERIAVELRSLIAFSDQIDHSIETNGLAAGRQSFHHDEIVELDPPVFFHTDPKLERCGVHRAQHQTHGLAFHQRTGDLFNHGCLLVPL